MTHRWDQSAGLWTFPDGSTARGYSGADLGKNNPAMQAARNVGPIPVGVWLIVGERDSPNTGPFTIALNPAEGTDTLGRADFRVHGDSISHPGEASHGCIILPRPVREKIWSSGDRNLTVNP